MFFYSFYKYIQKILSIIKIKAKCLHQVFYMFKLKNHSIVSILLEESKYNESIIKNNDLLTINYIDDYSL